MSFVPPVILDSPAQKAIWARMKQENTYGYKQIIYNTTWDRYADLGRWEMLGALINDDATLAAKSFSEMKLWTSNWTVVIAGNESREMWIELCIHYAALYKWLTEAQRTEYINYLMAVAEKFLTALRTYDSDQATCNYFGLAMTDKVLGTTYMQRFYVDPGIAQHLNPFPVGALDAPDFINGKRTLRGVVRSFFRDFGKGGSWMESSEYNTGTTWVVMCGVFYLDPTFQFFPEAKQWAIERAKMLLYEITPDLKDSYQWGDVQSTRYLRLSLDYADLWTLWQGVMDTIGETALANKLRQLEADVYVANGVTAINPLYARYYYTQNPFGAKQAWRENGLVKAEGIGLALWRHNNQGGYQHSPFWQYGAVDHAQAWGCNDVRTRKNEFWIEDHPICYAPDQRYLNQVVINGLGCSFESGGLVASRYIPGKLVYIAGMNCGVSPLVYQGYGTQIGSDGKVPYTTQHENMRSTIHLLDTDDLLDIVVDRVHADDVKLETITNQWGTFGWEQLYPYASQKSIINSRTGVTDWIWHSKSVPTVNSDGFTTDGGVKVVRLTSDPVNTIVVNEQLPSNDPNAIPHGYCEPTGSKPGCLGGYVGVGERRWAIHEVPLTHKAFQLHIHVMFTGNVTVARIDLGEVQGVRIIRPNMQTLEFYFSAKPGPRIMSLAEKTTSGGSIIKYDPTKFAKVRDGRLLTSKVAASPGVKAYYADLNDTLVEDTDPVPTSSLSVSPSSSVSISASSSGSSSTSASKSPSSSSSRSVSASVSPSSSSSRSSSPSLSSSPSGSASKSPSSSGSTSKSPSASGSGSKSPSSSASASPSAPAPGDVCIIDDTTFDRGEIVVETTQANGYKDLKAKYKAAGFIHLETYKERNELHVTFQCMPQTPGTGPRSLMTRDVVDFEIITINDKINVQVEERRKHRDDEFKRREKEAKEIEKDLKRTSKLVDKHLKGR